MNAPAPSRRQITITVPTAALAGLTTDELATVVDAATRQLEAAAQRLLHDRPTRTSP